MRKLCLIAAFALAACAPPRASVEAEGCTGSAEERVIATMYFGRNIGGELGVSEAAWDAFVDAEITPRFPDGLTVADAEGQWRDTETGAIVREPSKQLTVFLADETEGRAALDRIAEAYKRQFQQQAVALVVERSCVSFE
ncbi:MAG TPA: DUF3574 domain-containing protein [Vitreimonas sp.]|uniref:DUF3574 domain-containing protein n=1 Tax=Vitreimonas sp. TaxID=3069702 RepID=UPI002D3D7700|nr:DUF3574 domain-containing protein [Vitreimonas sp.]HYD87800.1 DUF3574 domain-containing protein [Vitreimonas sp.]